MRCISYFGAQPSTLVCEWVWPGEWIFALQRLSRALVINNTPGSWCTHRVPKRPSDKCIIYVCWGFLFVRMLCDCVLLETEGGWADQSAQPPVAIQPTLRLRSHTKASHREAGSPLLHLPTIKPTYKMYVVFFVFFPLDTLNNQIELPQFLCSPPPSNSSLIYGQK